MAELEMLLFEQSPNAMLYFDSTLCLQMMNHQAERVWQRRRADTLGSAAAELRFEGVEAEEMRQVLSAGAALHIAARQVSIAQERYYLDTTYTPITMTAAQGILVTVREVSHEQELEQALREGRDELQAILDNIPDGVTLMQPDGLVRYNKSPGAKYEEEQREFVHLADFSVRKLCYPDGRPMPIEDYPITRAARGETFANEQLIITSAAGSTRHLSVSGGYWRDQNGTVRLGIVTARDITREYELERELKASGDELKEVLDNLPNAVILVEPNGRVRYRNQEHRRIVDVNEHNSVSSLVAQEHFYNYDATQMEIEQLPIIRALRGERFSDAEVSLIVDGERRYYIVSGASVLDANGNVRLAMTVTYDVTRIRELEQEAQAGRSELQAVLDNMGEPLLLMAADSSVRYLNRAAYRLIGLHPTTGEENISSTRMSNFGVLDVRYPDGREMLAEEYPQLRAARGEEVGSSEFSITDLKGNYHLLSTNTTALRDESGAINRVLMVGRDITHERQLEQELQRRASELQLILDNLPDAVVLIEPSGVIRYRNQAHRHMIGQVTHDEQLPSYQMVTLLRPDGSSVPDAELPVGLVSRGQDFSDLELAFTNHSGEQYVVSYNGTILHDADKRPYMGIVVGHDLTAIRQAEREVARWLGEAERERNRLLTVLEQMPEGVIITTAPDGNLVLLNRIAARLYGLDEELIPRVENRTLTHYETFTPEGPPLAVEARPLSRALRGETVVGTQMQVKLPDGTMRDLLVNAAPIVEGAEEEKRISGAVSVFQDVSALVALEKLKDEFISVTSHELRTPITSIKGYAEILVRKLARLDVDDTVHAELSKPVNVILEQAGRMTSLVNNLLDVSRMATGQFEVTGEAIDLSQLLTHAVELHNTISALPIQLELPDTAAMAYGDERLVEQVVNNLLANAVKYSPRGGEIVVRLDREDAAWRVSVSDKGIGLSRETKARLFERFYRGDTGRLVAPGLGLGLYIARNIVAGFGGRIWAASEGEGEGATFSFTLPLAEA